MGDKREEIVPVPEKGDRIQNEVVPVADGLGDEVVFIAKYNPDQMARCIDETYTTVLLFNKTGAWRDPYTGIAPEEEPKIVIRVKKRKAKENAASIERDTDEEEYYIPNVYPILKHIEYDEDHQRFRSIVSRYLEEKMPAKLQEFYSILVAEAMDYALREFAKSKRIKGWEKFSRPTKEDMEYLGKIVLQTMKERLDFRRGRRKGSTVVFEDEASFLAGLERTLAKFPEKPTEPEAWKKFQEDDALLDKNASFSVFRTWLDRCGLDWETALKRYWKPNQVAN